MDRNRLKDVRQSDLTESRVNEDFVYWLKTKGPTWLLLVLVALCSYVLYVRWTEHKARHITDAWAEFVNARLPSSLEEVADKYPDVGALPYLARLNAAQQLLKAVQTDQALNADSDNPIALTDEERTQYLDRADGLYADVIAADDHSEARTLVVVNALFGRAAVAESKGDADAAKGFYEQAAARVEPAFPELAVQADDRLDDLKVVESNITLPDAPPATAPPPAATGRTPLTISPSLSDLIAPKPKPAGGP